MTTETIAPKKAYATRSADAQGWYWGTGRRKTAVARVRVSECAIEIAARGQERADVDEVDPARLEHRAERLHVDDVHRAPWSLKSAATSASRSS